MISTPWRKNFEKYIGKIFCLGAGILPDSKNQLHHCRSGRIESQSQSFSRSFSISSGREGINYLCFGVSLRSKRNLPPSVKRVWASSPGKAPKIIKVIGIKAHWIKNKKKDNAVFFEPVRFWRQQITLKIAEVIIPNIAKAISKARYLGQVIRKKSEIKISSAQNQRQPTQSENYQSVGCLRIKNLQSR